MCVFNKSSSKVRISYVRSVAKRICSCLNYSTHLLINIVLLNNKSITALNRKYHYRNRPTDVIVFSYKYRSASYNDVLEGDVFVSVDQIKANSKRFKNSFYGELVLVVVHGILHAIGFEDSTRQKKTQMFKKQDQILSNII
ncbi:MAG: rRNA maturation RNase YbeY [bacterium]